MRAWLAPMVVGLMWAPGRADLVDVRDACPGVRIELRYATERNGARRRLYPGDARCLLRRAVAERLARVQKRLARQGLGLQVWDAYRPLSAQRALWNAYPNRTFVASPRRGSKHNRGAAVDVTLTDAAGRELPMPCDFDTFNARARPTYRGGTHEQRLNRNRLRQAMRAEGFIPDRAEWWHYNAPDWRRYPLLDVPLTRKPRRPAP